MELDALESVLDGSIQPRDIKLSALDSITENFSIERIIDEDRFGTFYKGILRNGEVAVKRIRSSLTIDEKLFRREVNSLLKVNHKNIVRFLGFCSHTEHKAMEDPESGEFIYVEYRERLLCFEYINNGSLQKYIADELRGLPWDTRYSIIKGICEGVQYLHMEKRIVHMDLKPSNILLDGNMVPKITIHTYSTDHFLSPGYRAPEFIEGGHMSVKSDVYSLGIIIIQLVTGHRSIPDGDNVLRRWMHRWHKSGKETPFKYQQIAKLIEIGQLCQEKDPYSRPFISDIISVINELESTGMQINNGNESTGGQISPYSEDDMLGIAPLELCFHLELNNHTSCSLELTNETNAFFAFSIQTTSPLSYSIQPSKEIVAPQSKCSVKIILQPLDKAPQGYTGYFIVRSTKVNRSLIGEDITEDIFKRELVDEVNLTVTYKANEPQVDVSLGTLIISDTINLHGPQESDASPTEAQSKSYADAQFTLHSESTNTLWSSEMTDQATELQTLEGVLADANANPVRLSYPFIKSITRNFYEEIGRGGFGVVYTGHLRTGKIAVKKLSISQGFSDTPFAEEINCLMRTKHNNVVRFLGYCADTHGEFVPFNRSHVMAEIPQRLLCFEYVPNGNLQKYLKDNGCKDNWKIRYQMIRGICHGLNYLHDQRINHLDLKPDNILLDARLEPKITDFGLSRCFEEGISRVYTKFVRGTPGSIAPEFIHSGEITFKSDIYGLGIIIIKLLLGCNKFDFENWHTSIDMEGPQVKGCTEIARACVAFDQRERPTIGDIMQKLNEIERP